MLNIYLYVLYDPDKSNVCKVGIIKNPDQRLKTYRTAAPQSKWAYLRKLDRKYHEKEILNMMRGAFRVDRELVHALYRIVVNSIEGYFNDFL